MLGSILRYTENFTSLFASAKGRSLLSGGFQGSENTIDKAISAAFEWLLSAQREDGGMATWYWKKGWTSSYPETTGYIIPVLLEAGKYLNRTNEAEEASMKALDWLLQIQHENGGWPGGYVEQKRPPIVFNTGQIIRGMVASSKYFENNQFSESAKKAGDWLVSIQDQEGSWSQSVYMGKVRVYDTYVAAPLALLYRHTGEEKYSAAAQRQCEWVIDNKQHSNGWFEDADNTVKHNDRPILHTIAYTIDGLIETGLLLNNQKLIDSGIKASKILAEELLREGFLKGRYDKNWKGSEAFITTGGAQIAIAWNRLRAVSAEPIYQDAIKRMNDILLSLQIQESSLACEGALFGSAPIWGRYEAFGCPNWGTKYFLESLLMYVKANSNNS